MANIVGTKWGDSKLGTPGGLVTWSLAGAGLDITRFGTTTKKSTTGDTFLDYDYAKVIAEAFAEWSKYGDIEFKQVADRGGAAGTGTKADIRIFFGEIPGGTAGYAFYPSAFGSAIAGDVLLDTLASFNKDPELFKAVVMHEVGHSLGLGHVSENSIMTPTIRKIGLQADDIYGIQKIYGVQDGAPDNDGSSGEDDNATPPPPAPEDDHDHDGHNHSPDEDPNAQYLVGTSGTDKIYGKSGNDTIVGRGGNDLLYGGSDDDELNGGSGADRLEGNSGNDHLKGKSDRDVLIGGKGEDTLEGGTGKDKLKGGWDKDVLDGGSDNDWMKGGSDADIFVFQNNHGNDAIADFNAKISGEKIDLGDVSGFNSFRDVKNAATQKSGNVLIETSDDSSILLYNVNLGDLDSTDFLF